MNNNKTQNTPFGIIILIKIFFNREPDAQNSPKGMGEKNDV